MTEADSTILKNYETDGFAAPIRVIETARAASLRRQLEAYEAQRGHVDPKRQSRKTHLLLTWFDGLVRDAGVLDAVEQIIGEDILCWGTSFFIKEPKDGNFVSWHQDITYWGLEPAEDVTTAWTQAVNLTRTKLLGVPSLRSARHKPVACKVLRSCRTRVLHRRVPAGLHRVKPNSGLPRP